MRDALGVPMKRVLCASLALYLWLPGGSSASTGQAVEPESGSRVTLAMEVLLKKPEERVYEIHVHLTNTNTEPVIVNLRDLPWLPPNDVGWLSVFRMDSRRSRMRQDSFPGSSGHKASAWSLANRSKAS